MLLLGKLRYANNSNYKNDVMIRKEVRCFSVLLCALSGNRLVRLYVYAMDFLKFHSIAHGPPMRFARG